MQATPPGILNNFIITTIINLNFRVLINLFLYSAAATSGILISSKTITLLFEELLKFLRFRWEVKYKDKIKEIRELNTKVHDRLVELEETIRANKYPTDKTRRRLLYNASRLAKYDKTIVNDVYTLLNDWTVNLSLKERGNITPGRLSESKAKHLNLIKKIKLKVDKLLKLK